MIQPAPAAPAAPAGVAGVAGLLSSPELSVGAGVRGWLESGGIHPRAVSVLGGALGRFSVGVGGVDVVDSPTGAQVVNIVSVDGEPVGPHNFAARELVGWLAGLQTGVRPDQIGSPWLIRSPGFFSDQTSTTSIRLVFDSPTTSPTSGSSAPTADVAGTTTPGGGAVDMTPAPPTAAPDVSPAAQAAFKAAQGELGVPYLWGGESPQSGFDCSGLMQWAYHQAGISIPRTAAEQATIGTPVSQSQLREGDLVFFRISGGEIDHVGMYVGHGQFIEAPRTGEVVQKANLNDTYWASHFAAARRIVPVPTSPPAPATGAPTTSPPAPPTSPAAPTTAPPGPPSPASLVPSAGGSDPAAIAAETPGAVAASPGSTSGASDPSTISFRAAVPPTTAGGSNTVKFLPAVQLPASPASSPEIPNAPAPAEPAQPLGEPAAPLAQPVQPSAQPVEPPAQPVQPSVQPVQPSVQPPAQLPEPPASVSAPVESIDAVPPGAPLSVSSHLLTNGQAEFAAKLAQLTGLSPRVIAAWELAEESGQYAQGREAQHDFNWLNIAWYDSGRGSLSYNAAFGNPVTAAEQTAHFLKGTWGGASESIRAIVSTANGTPAQQIAAIANSDWASTHYNGGANLRATFNELNDMKVEVNTAATAGGVPPATAGTVPPVAAGTVQPATAGTVQPVAAGTVQPVAAAEASIASAGSVGEQQGDVTFGDLQSIGAHHGWTEQQLQDWWQVIKIESGGRLNAQNPSSSAYGIAQFISGASEYASYGGNSTSVTGQLTAMANYIAQRYGSPTEALAHEHSAGWY